MKTLIHFFRNPAHLFSRSICLPHFYFWKTLPSVFHCFSPSSQRGGRPTSPRFVAETPTAPEILRRDLLPAIPPRPAPRPETPLYLRLEGWVSTLAPIGTDWHRLAPIGTDWHRTRCFQPRSNHMRNPLSGQASEIHYTILHYTYCTSIDSKLQTAVDLAYDAGRQAGSETANPRVP